MAARSWRAPLGCASGLVGACGALWRSWWPARRGHGGLPPGGGCQSPSARPAGPFEVTAEGGLGNKSPACAGGAFFGGGPASGTFADLSRSAYNATGDDAFAGVANLSMRFSQT